MEQASTRPYVDGRPEGAIGEREKIRQEQEIISYHCIWHLEQREGHVTEVLDGGVDGVAAIEEEADRP